jgi:hypothetical protein
MTKLLDEKIVEALPLMVLSFSFSLRCLCGFASLRALFFLVPGRLD